MHVKNVIVAMWIFLVSLVPTSVSAQGNGWAILGVEKTDANPEEWKIPSDSLTARTLIVDKLNEFQLQGYLEVRITSFEFQQKEVVFNLGPKYEWVRLDKLKKDELFFDPVLGRVELEGTNVNSEQVESLSERLLTYAENNGYPFASVSLDSVGIKEGAVSAQLNISKGPLVLIDSLVLAGDANISQSFMENYLGIHSGDPYSEKLIRQVSQKISGLAFLRMENDPKVYFSNQGARVLIQLEGVNASRFDFLIGVLPGSETNDGQLLINGEADLNLVNPFGTGKSLQLKWENPKPRSPILNIDFDYPYLLSLPLGVDYHFNLFKNDTFYLDIIHQFGVRWLYGAGNYLRANFTRKTSNLISIDEDRISTSGNLPEQLDVVNTTSGLEWQYQKLDYRFNPLTGWRVKIGMEGGIRRIEENALILDLSNEDRNFQEKYDSLKAGTSIVQTQVDVSRFWRVGNQSTILTRGRFGYQSAQGLLRNDLWFIGGSQIIRGFDEASIEASAYGILTVEYRYLIGRNAYLGAFYDASYIERNIVGNYRKSFPMGMGINLALETNAGIFAVSYALGKRDLDQPVALRNGKIHFGYQNYF